jgi:hypothetical protein
VEGHGLPTLLVRAICILTLEGIETTEAVLCDGDSESLGSRCLTNWKHRVGNSIGDVG